MVRFEETVRGITGTPSEVRRVAIEGSIGDSMQGHGGREGKASEALC